MAINRTNIKYLLLFVLLFIVGYQYSKIFNYYIFPNVVPVSTKVLKYMSSQKNFLNTLIIKNIVLFLFSEGINSLLFFLTCVVITGLTGLKRRWLIGYLIGAVIINIGVNATSILFFFVDTENTSLGNMRPVFWGLFSTLILMPTLFFFSWSLGLWIRNQVKGNKENKGQANNT